MAKDKERKKGRIARALGCSLLLGLLALPTPPAEAAAGEPPAREATFSIESRRLEDKEEKAGEMLPETVREGGKDYVRERIRYELIDVEYLGRKEKAVEGKEAPAKTLSEGGTTWTLREMEKEERAVRDASIQAVAAYDDYGHAVTAASVPATKTVRAVNAVTGKEESVSCRLTGIRRAGKRAVQNTMTVTFTDYGAAYYEWDGEYIRRDDDAPPLEGYEERLLAAAGAGEGSKVTGMRWAGEPYEEDGVLCRDAAVSVEQQATAYRAEYAGAIRTPGETETVYRAVYTAPDEGGPSRLTYRATATYRQDEGASALPYILAGIGIVLALGLAVLILFLIRKRKKEKEEESIYG